jgi:hypothetical protein
MFLSFSIHQEEIVKSMTKYLVCKCGWKSQPYPDTTAFVGLGGTLGCPECTKFRRNPTLEGLFGHVHVETIDEPYNPSKRKNIPDFDTPFYCELLDIEVTSEFCLKCNYGKLKHNFPRCKWIRNRRMKQLEKEETI